MAEDHDPDKIYQIGDLVWAKMKGYSPWPGKVSAPRNDMKKPGKVKNSYCIFFFGSNNFSWIEKSHIKSYVGNEDYGKGTKTGAFREAIAAIEKYIDTKANGLVPDEDLLDREEYNDDLVVKEDVEVKQEPLTTLAPKAKVGRKKRLTETNGVGSEEPLVVKTPKKRKLAEEKKVFLPSPSTSKLTNNSAPRSKSAVKVFLNRSHTSAPVEEPIDIMHVSQELKDKKIVPSSLKFGFLGLGIMGSGITKNLLNSGHCVTIWNRTPEKCHKFDDIGAVVAMTPSDVVAGSDIIFSCVADPQAAKDMVFGNCGVLSEINATKNYIEMTGMDSDSSQDIGEAIQGKGGRYLEAQIQGSKTEAENGKLVLIAAGNRSLFDECESAFQAIATKVFFVGSIGNACKMNLLLQMMSGIMLAGVAEGMALADQLGLDPQSIFNILKETAMSSPLVVDKVPSMIAMKFPLKHPLVHMQKDLNLAVALGNACDQPLPLGSTANECFKHAKRLGYGEQDAAAIIYHNKF